MLPVIGVTGFFWLEVFRVNEQCKGKAEDLMKKEVIFNCVALFCMFLYTSLYSAVTAHISIFQPFV